MHYDDFRYWLITWSTQDEYFYTNRIRVTVTILIHFGKNRILPQFYSLQLSGVHVIIYNVYKCIICDICSYS